MKKFKKEFKDFIQRGNVLDLAIGMIMGASFNSIVTSLVNDIMMPVVGVIIGGLDFSGLSFNINDATIAYGNFIQNVVNFLIVAFCLFYIIKFINKITKKPKNEDKKELPKKTEEQILLEEIRDLLKESKGKKNKKN